MIEPIEYSLVISTGEVLLFSEINEEIYPEFDSKVRNELSDLIARCTTVSFEILEEAKSGYSKRFESSLKIPPWGALLKIEKPICSQIRNCAMSDLSICTTRNIKKNLGLFPECFEYNSDSGLFVKDLSRIIIQAWRHNRYVLIVPRSSA